MFRSFPSSIVHYSCWPWMISQHLFDAQSHILFTILTGGLTGLRSGLFPAYLLFSEHELYYPQEHFLKLSLYSVEGLSL